MAWIELHQSIWTHPKTYRLAKELKIEPMYAASHLIRFWCWALDVVDESGDISYLPDEEIAAGAGWRKQAHTFVCALISTGWIDADVSGKHIHDWEDYAGKLLSKRKADRERKRTRNNHRNSNGIPTESPQENLENSNRNRTLTVPYHIEREKDARACVELWETITGGTIPRDMAQEIITRLNMDTDVELVKEGIRLSAGKSSPTAYMRKCLQNWTADGIKTYQDYCKRNKSSNAPKPKADLSSPETYADVEGDDLD